LLPEVKDFHPADISSSGISSSHEYSDLKRSLLPEVKYFHPADISSS
jgi:hypothetical protein